MNQLFEYTDKLNNPYECFICSNQLHSLPIKPHFHYFVEILFMREGSILVEGDADSYILNAGDMILFPPFFIHSMYALSDAPFRYDVLKFDPALLNTRSQNNHGITVNLSVLFAWLKKQTLPDNLTADEKNAPAEIYFSAETLSAFPISSLFDLCLIEMKEKQYGYQTLLHAKISELLTYLLRIWRANGLDTDMLYAPAEESESIYNITEYIDRHSNESLKVSALAKQCNMSYSYFAKSFHRLYGQSCKKYIETLRLSKAEDMLLFTSFDLNYISQETGFSDCSHLIHSFKEKHGITPHQYRLRHPAH